LVQNGWVQTANRLVQIANGYVQIANGSVPIAGGNRTPLVVVDPFVVNNFKKALPPDIPLAELSTFKLAANQRQISHE
jgi:hypothetical protein